MKDSYPKYKKEGIKTESIYQKFNPEDRNIIDKFLQYCSISAGQRKISDIKLMIVQFRDILEKSLDYIHLEDLIVYLSVLNKSDKTNYSRNSFKVYIKKFLKWKYKDWSLRFNDLVDIKTHRKPFNQNKINDSTLVTPEELNMLLRACKNLKEKALLSSLYESGARPEEIYKMKWLHLRFLEKGITKIQLNSNKTETSRPMWLKNSTIHLKRWKEEYEYYDRKESDYIFPKAKHRNEPMTRTTLHLWLKRLCKRAGLNREIFPYLLRHTRLTEIYNLIKDPKVYEKIAGHGQRMMEIYVHLSSKMVEDSVLTKVLKVEEPSPEVKHSLELKIEKLEKELVTYKEDMKVIKNHFPMISDLWNQKIPIELLKMEVTRREQSNQAHKSFTF